MVANRIAVRGSLLLALTSISVTSGCGSDIESAITEVVLGDLGNLYLEYVELLGGADEFFCECSIAAGEYVDMQECVAAIGGPIVPPILAQCYAQVFDDMGTAREYIECQITEYITYFDCLEAAGCGGDLLACNALLGDGDCPKLTYGDDAALAAECLGFEMPAPYVCADGSEIAPWHECNFFPECADGSDEHAQCPNGYACEGGDVIPQPWTCDGVADCPAGDDEVNCG
jgi:hypothetical protein